MRSTGTFKLKILRGINGSRIQWRACRRITVYELRVIVIEKFQKQSVIFHVFNESGNMMMRMQFQTKRLIY